MNDKKQLIWAGIALTGVESIPQSNFGVCVEGERLIATGERDQLRSRYPDAQIVGGSHLLLAPAMVNSHDHGRGLGTASLGVPDDLLEIWLLRLSSLPAIDPYLAAAYDGLRLLRSGVGTVAHSHNPRNWNNMAAEAAATIRGYQDAGIRVAFHPPIVAQNLLVYDNAGGFLASLPPSLQQAARMFLEPALLSGPDYFALCSDLFKTYHDAQQHTVHIQVSPAGGQWCSDELIQAAVDFAQRHQTRVQMHLLETRYQRHYAARRWGKSFVQHLEEIGALGPWLTCAHMVWVDESDLPLLAERGVGIAHNPSSNLRLRSGTAPVAQMLAAGIPLGIGLDGHALDDDQDYLREMRLAWTLSNQPGASSPTVEAARIWQMGTTGGVAITLGSDVPLGRLAAGALADLVLIDWQAVQGLWSELSPVEGLLRRATRQQVKHVMVNGRWVVWDSCSQTLDEGMISSALRSELAKPNLTERQEAAAAYRLATYLRRFYAEWDCM